MRPVTSDVLAGRPRKSSNPDRDPAGIASSPLHSQGQDTATNTLLRPRQTPTFFLADEATMSATTVSHSAAFVNGGGSSGSSTNRFQWDSPNSKAPTSNTSSPKALATQSSSIVDLTSTLIGSEAELVHVSDAEDSEGMLDELEEDDNERGSVGSYPSSLPDGTNLPIQSSFPHSAISNSSFASTPNLSSKSLDSELERLESPKQAFSLLGTSESTTTTNLNQRNDGKTPLDSLMMAGSSSSVLFAPELIMPTIKMPARRPFTKRGKEVGRLKILVAGDSGIGKTSFIKSLIQTNEDIVHVDPQSQGSSVVNSYDVLEQQTETKTTKRITEVYVSTKPYPHWWSDVEDSRILRRRKSGGEVVLERNICLVDTPGYGAGLSFSECIEPVVRYVEQQMEKTVGTFTGDDSDLLSLLSGSGSPQVDLVLYLVLHRLKPVDIDFIRRLSAMTNVLPVIAKSDTLSPQEITDLKLSILNDLRNAGIRAFLFGKSADDVARGLSITPPYAISSIKTQDDNMDASLLMAPNYQPPLHTSELSDLISAIFDSENVAWLRHASTKKFLSWRSSSPSAHLRNHSSSSRSFSSRANSPNISRSLTMTPSSSSFLSLANPKQALGATNTTSFSIGNNTSIIPNNAHTYNLARLADHTLREERLANISLARWAHKLQNSLQAERERYSRLANGERAVWLTERLGECVIDGTLVPVNKLHLTSGSATAPTGVEMGLVVTEKGGRRIVHVNSSGHAMDGCDGVGFDRRDPLGILRLSDDVKRKAGVLCRVVTAGSAVGVAAVLVLRYVWGLVGVTTSSLYPQLDDI